MIKKFDKEYYLNEIKKICILIEKEINQTNDNKLLPQTIKKFRDLLDATFPFLYIEFTKDESTFEQYHLIKKSIKYFRKKFDNENVFLLNFYDSFQIMVSHYEISDEESKRLTNKYISFLIKYKHYLSKFGLEIFVNIKNYPFNLDKLTTSYYCAIIYVINAVNKKDEIKEYQFYILKKKVIYIKHEKLYEYTLANCADKIEKSDNFIAYSKIDLIDFYCVKCKFVNKKFIFLEKQNQLMIIVDYDIHIRPCELQHYGWILFGNKTTRPNKTQTYKAVMDFIKNSGNNLSKIISTDYLYDALVSNLKKIKKPAPLIINILKESHKLIKSKSNGYKVILYILCLMNNSIIKDQIYIKQNKKMSNLFLKESAMVFEKTPYTGNLNGHKTKISCLYSIFNPKEYEDEIFANSIISKSNDLNQLYHKFKKTNTEIPKLIEKYNKKVSRDMQIGTYYNNAYIVGYEKCTKNILKIILSKRTTPIFKENMYCNYAKSFLEKNNIKIDDFKKRHAIINNFQHSNLLCIYGAAGTGKTNLISSQLNIFKQCNYKILCIANTHTALDNLKNVINNQNVIFKTAASVAKSSVRNEYDILVADECTCISSRIFSKILEKVSFKLLILAGDIYQIDSIEYGNWFYLLKCFLNKSQYVELTEQYRSHEPNLLKFWKEVRKNGSKIKEYSAKFHISRSLDKTIFDNNDDSITLCLNYHGPYGINNINNILQANNVSTEYIVNNKPYKINDPIIFNPTLKFSKLFYNNLKGKIINISQSKFNTVFTIEIYKSIIDTQNVKDVSVKDVLKNNHTIIDILVKHSSSEIYDSDSNEDYLVPFHIAYATSIHKAQGLEYKNVKVIITDEMCENITHNVFYTSITRAKENLTVYWSPISEDKIIANFKSLKLKNNDYQIIKEKYKDLT